MSGLAPWALAALIPYAALQIAFLRRLAKAPEALGGSGFAAAGRARWRRYVARRVAGAAFGAAFWALCVLAASGSVRVPRYATQTVAGAELAFVVDASNSMLSADDGPSRLELAREFVSRAAAAADGAGLSVVAFRGLPVTLCPSTRDRKAFADALAWAGPAVTSAAGSDVGAAIDEALRPSFATGTARLVILLSDGNDTGGRARAAAASAAASGAALVVVGFGTEEPAVVVDMDGKPVLGDAGTPIKKAIDEEAMRDWAAAGRGEYLRAADPASLGRVASACAAVAASSGSRRNVRVEVDASSGLAALALVALSLAAIASGPALEPRRSSRRRSSDRTGRRP